MPVSFMNIGTCSITSNSFDGYSANDNELPTERATNTQAHTEWENERDFKLQGWTRSALDFEIFWKSTHRFSPAVSCNSWVLYIYFEASCNTFFEGKMDMVTFSHFITIHIHEAILAEPETNTRTKQVDLQNVAYGAFILTCHRFK